MQQPANLTEVFNDAHLRAYQKGQILLYQGETTQDVFHIKKGYVKVYDISSQGSEKLIMLLGPSDIFPLVWTLDSSDSIRYFYETYDEAEVCVIPRSDFVSAIKSSHELAIHILEYFATRTSELMHRIDCIEATSAKHKVAQVLSYLASAHGDAIAKSTYKVRIAITHQSIADMAGINRATASIQMKELEDGKMFKDTSSKGLIIHSDRIDKFLEQS